jgi:hypothetical protein
MSLEYRFRISKEERDKHKDTFGISFKNRNFFHEKKVKENEYF